MAVSFDETSGSDSDVRRVVGFVSSPERARFEEKCVLTGSGTGG
jgi:hypothetical protein